MCSARLSRSRSFSGTACSPWVRLALAFVLLGALGFAGCSGNSPTSLAPSGSGVQPGPRSVALAWDPSSSSGVVGYNVYRGAQMGGPYTKLNGMLISETAYTDATIQAGQTYFYVTSAVDAQGVESVFSGEVHVTIPTT